MLESLRHLSVEDDDLVDADHMVAALTAGTLIFADGATQVFTAAGGTTYYEHGRRSQGDWWVLGDGKFASMWPPDYKATYTLRWVVGNGAITGLSFTETEKGTRFNGRFL
jgi:hypothetical protein